MKVLVKLNDRPKLKDPQVVCGLPGSGFVGKLAVNHLISELKSKLLGEIYSSSFPPQVVVRDDGSVDLMKNQLYFWKRPDAGSDLILFTGDAQPANPEAEYEIADEVVRITRSLGATNVFTLAAYITGAFVDKPKVYGTATEVNLLRELEKYGVLNMKEGGITGMNGLLIGLAKIRGMKGICLLGETSGYVVDAKASQAVLEVLINMLGIKVNMENLEQRTKETEMIIKSIEERRRPPSEKPRDIPSRDFGYIH